MPITNQDFFNACGKYPKSQGQLDMCNHMLDCIEDDKKQHSFYKSPTGSGKTLAAAIAYKLNKKYTNLLIVVPSRHLKKPWVDECKIFQTPLFPLHSRDVCDKHAECPGCYEEKCEIHVEPLLEDQKLSYIGEDILNNLFKDRKNWHDEEKFFSHSSGFNMRPVINHVVKKWEYPHLVGDYNFVLTEAGDMIQHKRKDQILIVDEAEQLLSRSTNLVQVKFYLDRVNKYVDELYNFVIKEEKRKEEAAKKNREFFVPNLSRKVAVQNLNNTIHEIVKILIEEANKTLSVAYDSPYKREEVYVTKALSLLPANPLLGNIEEYLSLDPEIFYTKEEKKEFEKMYNSIMKFLTYAYDPKYRDCKPAQFVIFKNAKNQNVVTFLDPEYIMKLVNTFNSYKKVLFLSATIPKFMKVLFPEADDTYNIPSNALDSHRYQIDTYNDGGLIISKSGSTLRYDEIIDITLSLSGRKIIALKNKYLCTEMIKMLKKRGITPFVLFNVIDDSDTEFYDEANRFGVSTDGIGIINNLGQVEGHNFLNQNDLAPEYLLIVGLPIPKTSLDGLDMAAALEKAGVNHQVAWEYIMAESGKAKQQQLEGRMLRSSKDNPKIFHVGSEFSKPCWWYAKAETLLGGEGCVPYNPGTIYKKKKLKLGDINGI